MEQSVDNALECLRLLETREASPAVYVAIHGHDYETINWYVGQFLDRVSDLNVDFQGFAIGSLVPLREDTATLVDVVQGARDAIPDSRSEDLGLHVFGVGGRFCSLLALLGVDSFDSTTYARAAQYKKFIDPTNWQKIEAKDIPADWKCDCQACQNLDPEVMTEVLYDDRSYESINGYMKSDFYAIIAYHNFLVYQRELDAVRSRIDEGDGALLDYVAELATDEIDGIRKGLKRAQRRDSSLAKHLRNRGFDHLVPHRQQTLNTGVPVVEDTERTISLDLSPTDFDIRRRDDYEPPDEESVLLVIPCSQQKPYSQSRTHRVVQDALSQYWNKVHKVTLSGLFGPVPEAYEEAGPVKSYEYVLTGADTDQQQVVINRLSSYLDRYGDRFEVIIGYATNKTYRHVISSAFDRYENDTVLLPADPPVLQLTEYFRGEHIDELRETVASSVSADDTQQRTL
jgi:predicted RNA-binding protein